MMNWIKFIFFITALLILREAFTETAGILLVGNGADWIAIKNVGLLLMDLWLGLGILFSIFLSKEVFPTNLTLGMVVLAIILHASKTVEYLFTPELAYCYYPAMFWINNLKLIMLLAALGSALSGKAVKSNSTTFKNRITNGI